MSDKFRYIIFTICDFAFSLGGSSAVIVVNCISPDNSVGYKLTLSGIVLLVFLILTAKSLFEKSYRKKYDTLLQQLAEATSPEDKQSISLTLNAHKLKNDIYQRLMVLLPFAILYIVTWLGTTSLASLQSTVGLILASLSAGSVFSVIRKPLGEKLSLEKITRKK